MTTQSTHPNTRRRDTVQDHEYRVRAIADHHALPVGTLTARSERVLVSCSSVHDLTTWLTVLGGAVTVTPDGTGLELWTLRTHTPPLPDGRRTMIWVSASTLDGELVDAELRAAITPAAAVDGPHRITVRGIPAGVTLDVSAYLTHVVRDLARVAEEDPQGLIEDLTVIAAYARSAEAQGPDSHAAHQRDDMIGQLLLEVAGDGELPIYGAQVERLAHQLLRLSPPVAVAL